jgi:catechol 2,3-dioxygenase-like lactoylglutathione lyase family enzyme
MRIQSTVAFTREQLYQRVWSKPLSVVLPSGRKMAERAVAAGYTTARPIVDGTNFVKDPDGYTIELYQRPAARTPP